MGLPENFKTGIVLGNVAEEIHIVFGVTAINSPPECFGLLRLPRIACRSTSHFVPSNLPTAIRVPLLAQCHIPVGNQEFIAFCRSIKVDAIQECWQINGYLTVFS